MKTSVQLWSNLAQLLLEWQMFHTKFVQKIKTRLFLFHGFSQNRAFWKINITEREFPPRWKIVHTLVKQVWPNYAGRQTTSKLEYI